VNPALLIGHAKMIEFGAWVTDPPGLTVIASTGGPYTSVGASHAGFDCARGHSEGKSDSIGFQGDRVSRITPSRTMRMPNEYLVLSVRALYPKGSYYPP